MEIVRSLVQSLIFVIILAVIMEMFLPIGEMKKYVKMVMGLLIIIAVVQAVVELTNRNYSGEFPFLTHKEDKMQLSGIIEAGTRISSSQIDKAIENYRKGISSQVMGLARLNKDTDVVDVCVEIQSDQTQPGFGQLKEIILTVQRDSVPQGKKDGEPLKERVKPVSVSVGRQSSDIAAAGPGPPRESVESMINTIANFYNLRPEQVQVVYGQDQ